MNDTLDVQTIARWVRLSPRKVRYVLEQRLLPGLRGRSQKHLAGRPRSFTRMEAFFVSCAALFLEGGAQRKTVTEVLARLADMPWPVRGSPAEAAGSGWRTAPRFGTAVEAMYWLPEKPALLLIGDGINLRLQLGGEDTGWLEPRSLARLADAYRPIVTIQFDLAPLHAAFDPTRPR
jgi:hypothetical protein